MEIARKKERMGKKLEVVNMSENSNGKIEGKGVIKCDSNLFGSFITTCFTWKMVSTKL